MKKYLVYSVLLTAALLPVTILALEVDFPTVGVGGLEPEKSFGPGQWVQYLFVFGLAVVGLAIIYALVRAGFLWMTAGDNSGKITEAKDRIKGAVIGLVILVGSYTFLNTINPQLVSIRNPRINIDVQDTWLKNFGVGWNKLYNPPTLTNEQKAPFEQLPTCDINNEKSCPVGKRCIEYPGVGQPRCDSNFYLTGAGCEKDEQCAVGKCVQEGILGKTCSGTPRSNGEKCDRNEHCRSGWCNPESRICAEEPAGPPPPPSNAPPANTAVGTGGAPTATAWPFGFKAGDTFFVDKSKFANPDEAGNGLRMRSAPAGSVMKGAGGSELKFPYDTSGQIIKFAGRKPLLGVDFEWFEVLIGGQKGYVAGEFITKAE